MYKRMNQNVLNGLKETDQKNLLTFNACNSKISLKCHLAFYFAPRAVDRTDRKCNFVVIVLIISFRVFFSQVTSKINKFNFSKIKKRDASISIKLYKAKNEIPFHKLF